MSAMVRIFSLGEDGMFHSTRRQVVSGRLAGRVLLGLKPLALRARGFKPNKTLLLVF